MKKKKALALGIDVGGTNIKAGLVDFAGRVLQAEVIPTQKEKGAEYVLKQIEKLSNKLCESTAEKILGVGLALPGEVDNQRGYCLYCPNLKWGELEVSKYLTKGTGLPVKLVNDANAACLGEYFYGGGKGVSTFLSLTLGTGVGSGLILARRLYTGRFGSGVEAGHMVIESNGYPCACGRRGCWETLVSGPALVRRTKEKLAKMAESKLASSVSPEEQNLTPPIIFQACREGDPLARVVVEETIFYLAVGLANLINLFNPYKISLGGGVAEAEEIKCSQLMEQVNNRVFPTMRGKVEIFKANQGYYGGVVGAASLWLHTIKTI